LLPIATQAKLVAQYGENYGIITVIS